jgi:hypothetical protein
MEDIEQRSTFNGMVINGEKICTYQNSTKIFSSELHINYNNTVLENVESKKLLDVIVDNHLCWKAHINDIASNLSSVPPNQNVYATSNKLGFYFIKRSFNQRLIIAALFGDNHHPLQEYTNYKNLS